MAAELHVNWVTVAGLYIEKTVEEKHIWLKFCPILWFQPNPAKLIIFPYPFVFISNG